MRVNPKEGPQINPTEKLKARAIELLNESQAVQFVEAMRLNRAASVVFSRESERLAKKHGLKDDRTLEMKARAEATAEAKTELFTRYTDAIRPPTEAGKGWAVDGFVRSAQGAGLSGLSVAGYDRSGEQLKGYGPVKTDDRGFFSIKIEKLDKGATDPIFIRASKGSRILTSNEVGLVPMPGESERVEILVGERGSNEPIEPKDDKPNVDPRDTGGKGKDDTPGRIDPTKPEPSKPDPNKPDPGKVDPRKIDPGKSPGGERGRTDDPRDPKTKK